MKTSEFDYRLPPDRIAQTPIEPRHASRLLVLNRVKESIEHSIFWNIGNYLSMGDLLVINETRVIPARLYAHKQTGGKIEILLLNKIDQISWEVMVGGKRISERLQFAVIGGPTGRVIAVLEGSKRIIQFNEPIEDYYETAGHVPLPPYIHEKLDEPERYQTVYSAVPGSTAAPTAGLHFTQELLQHLQKQGIRFAKVTLQVGLDTFAPVTEELAEDHKIHSEWCSINQDTIDAIRDTKSKGKRVIAVGTTSVRTLESAAFDVSKNKILQPYEGHTNLYILPGYEFKVVDALITNFHLPRSTLLMLVSAFAGKDRILNAYQLAVEEGYRFFSFGDAMLIQ